MAVQYRQAPIVGEEGCVRVDEEGYVSVPATDWLNPNGFSFLLDFQADLVQEQTVLGAAESEGSRIVLKQHVDGEPNTMRLEIGHARDRRIVADFKASDAHGKRVLCTAYPARADAELFELRPWGSLEPADVVYRRRDPLGDLGPLTNSLLLSGCQVDGKREGAFTGRLANFAVFDHPLSSDRLSDYRAASVTRGSEDVPAISVGSLDSAGRDLLLDDYERLRTWAGGTMTPRDTRDASVLAYRWLCDRTPLLRRAANEFGVQVSLPDLDPMRDYTNAVREDNPVFLYHRDRWEGDWLPPSAFLNDMALADRRIAVD